MSVDLIITNGRVIDPANNVDDVLDVAIKDGKIWETGKKLSVPTQSSFDAAGCIVTPGLIDAHVHCYEYATPLGVNPDNACLARGVTTIIDAGSSGASTFLGLRKYVVEKCKTRVRCLLHIAQHGLAAAGCSAGAAGGESDTLAILDEGACAECIRNNRDVIVGVKVRLSSDVCDQGRTEVEAYRRALSASKACSVPLMTHHVGSVVPTQHSEDPTVPLSCPGSLRSGDIYTHSFHGYRNSIIDVKTGRMLSDVTDAKARGVLFDVGHGAGGFCWLGAEIAAKNKFYPDMLGSDLHTLNVDGPVYDLPTVMTKFLHIGMPLNDVIKAVTSTPAKAYGLDNEIGSLTPGITADVTVLKIADCDVNLEDPVGHTRNVRRRVVPVKVWTGGENYPITLPKEWPAKTLNKLAASNCSRLVINKDML